MHQGHDIVREAVSRRTFLVASGLGFGGLCLPDLLQAGNPGQKPRRAKSTILIWLSGGPSHIDTFDPKPEAPAEVRGEFRPIATSAPGVQLCEHLPLVARQAHHLAVVNSLGHANRSPNDHHYGYYYNLTGHPPDPRFVGLGNSRKPEPSDWPFIGSVVANRRPLHPYLPSLISLPIKEGPAGFTRPGQFAGRLGAEFDPLYIKGSPDRPLDFVVPSVTLEADMTPERLGSRQRLMQTLDAKAVALEQTVSGRTYGKHQDRAFSLLTSNRAKAAFDVSQEPLRLRERYGNTLPGMSFLMARRLVEAGVPFVTAYWRHQENRPCDDNAWDSHVDNFGVLKNCLLPTFDRCFSALLQDLHDRGILDETLVVVMGEMGRQPKIGDHRAGSGKAGRDHWVHCMSALFAGGGIRGGRTYGSSDRFGAYPKDRPVRPEDVAKTIYAAMGIDDLEAIDREGRPFNILPEGAPLTDLFR
jgi:hypothetical protein